jgi:hypothetical protein
LKRRAFKFLRRPALLRIFPLLGLSMAAREIFWAHFRHKAPEAGNEIPSRRFNLAIYKSCSVTLVVEQLPFKNANGQALEFYIPSPGERASGIMFL